MKATINDTSIAYDDVGAGPAIVLIHGFPFDRRVWHRQVSLKPSGLWQLWPRTWSDFSIISVLAGRFFAVLLWVVRCCFTCWIVTPTGSPEPVLCRAEVAAMT